MSNRFIITLTEETMAALEAAGRQGSLEYAEYMETMLHDALVHHLTEDILERNGELQERLRAAPKSGAGQAILGEIASNTRRLETVTRMDSTVTRMDSPIARVEPLEEGQC